MRLIRFGIEAIPNDKQIVPSELCKYLKTSTEFNEDKSVIQRNTDIVQKENETICGHLCLYVVDKSIP